MQASLSNGPISRRRQTLFSSSRPWFAIANIPFELGLRNFHPLIPFNKLALICRFSFSTRMTFARADRRFHGIFRSFRAKFGFHSESQIAQAVDPTHEFGFVSQYARSERTDQWQDASTHYETSLLSASRMRSAVSITLHAICGHVKRDAQIRSRASPRCAEALRDVRKDMFGTD